MPTLEQAGVMRVNSPIDNYIEFDSQVRTLGAAEHVGDLVVFARDTFSPTNKMDEFDAFILRSLEASRNQLFQEPEDLATTMEQDLETRIDELFPGFLNLFVKIDEVDQSKPL